MDNQLVKILIFTFPCYKKIGSPIYIPSQFFFQKKYSSFKNERFSIFLPQYDGREGRHTEWVFHCTISVNISLKKKVC